MRVKAKLNFGGQYAMRKGEVCELEDNPVTRALIEQGFLAVDAEPEPAPAEKPKEKDDQPLQEAEPETPEINLHGLRKEDLLKICEDKGIKVGKKAKKEDLIAALEAQE